MNTMSEQLLGTAYQQLCEHLLAIRKSGEWRTEAVSFDTYVKLRWSISKTRAKLLCDFAAFCQMARKDYLRVPDSPDNIKPILALPHKHWVATWKLCCDYADGKPINASHCQATMDHFGVVARKRIPDYILNRKQVRKAAATMAAFKDGEKLADQVGVEGLGKHWKEAVRVTIEADQFAYDERGGSEKEKPF